MILIIEIGPPGSGKTTWAKQYVKEHSNFIRICPDEIREEITGSIDNQTQNGKVWAIAKKRVADALPEHNVILDATNVKGKDRKKFIKELPAHTLRYKLFNVPTDECKRRIKNDIANGVSRSNVPDHVVDKIFENYYNNMSTIDKSIILQE